MKDSTDPVLLLLFTSPPGSDRAKHGLELARQSLMQGRQVAVVLMQDSVFLALKGSSLLPQGFEETSETYVLDEHIERRGYPRESLGPRVKVVGYDGLAELLMRDRTSMAGSFWLPQVADAVEEGAPTLKPVRLRVPFFRQHYDFTCGPAALIERLRTSW